MEPHSTYKNITFQAFSLSRLDSLLRYFNALSQSSRDCFGPHAFDRESVINLFNDSQEYLTYVAIDERFDEVVAYFVVKIGFLKHDEPRLSAYGLQLCMKTDCTIAPSVSDAYQEQGLGSKMLQFVINDLKLKGFKRIILWGGVQSDNIKAVKLYQRFGFKVLGEFAYHGMNEDMILDL